MPSTYTRSEILDYAQRIKEFCRTHSCTDCPLYRPDGCCDVFDSDPSEWDLPAEHPA